MIVPVFLLLDISLKEGARESESELLLDSGGHNVPPQEQGDLVAGVGFCLEWDEVKPSALSSDLVHSDIHLSLRGKVLQLSVIVLMALHVDAFVFPGG